MAHYSAAAAVCVLVLVQQPPADTPVTAVRVPGYQPPTWAGAAIRKQAHLGLAAGDLDAAEAEAISLGPPVR